jgi:hypothetical protein
MNRGIVMAGGECVHARERTGRAGRVAAANRGKCAKWM